MKIRSFDFEPIKGKCRIYGTVSLRNAFEVYSHKSEEYDWNGVAQGNNLRISKLQIGRLALFVYWRSSLP